MEPLTARQAQVLEIIQTFSQEAGYPPSIRELGRALKLRSLRGVTIHLDALVRKGYLHRSRRARGLRLTTAAQPARSIPLPVVGRIAAGQPVLAEGTIEDQVAVDQRFVPTPGCFLVRVHGDSMVEAGIHHGDFVVVQPQPVARHGEIVAVLLDGEATVKRWYRDGAQIRLQPATQTFKPILLHESELASRDIRLLGRVASVLRRMV